jgi:hypothetical protein
MAISKKKNNRIGGTKVGNHCILTKQSSDGGSFIVSEVRKNISVFFVSICYVANVQNVVKRTTGIRVQEIGQFKTGVSNSD